MIRYNELCNIHIYADIFNFKKNLILHYLI
jgi:hypothetical protein